MTKRIICLLLAVMMFAALPFAGAFAAGESVTETIQTETLQQFCDRLAQEGKIEKLDYNFCLDAIRQLNHWVKGVDWDESFPAPNNVDPITTLQAGVTSIKLPKSNKDAALVLGVELPASLATGETQIYTVVAKDTMIGICEKLHLDYSKCKDAILRLNGWSDYNLLTLHTGDKIKMPKSDADAAAVKAFLDAFTFSTPIDTLGPSEMAGLGRTLADFGLSPARISVTLGVGGRRETVLLGGKTPSGAETYAMKEGEGGIFTMATSVADTVPEDEFAFRGRALFAKMDGREVQGLELRSEDGPAMKLSFSENVWRITSPAAASADSAAVAALVEKLLSAKVLGFEPSDDLSESRLAALGVATGAGLAVTLRFGVDDVEQVVFGTATTNGVYVLLREGSVVARADPSIAESCRAGGRSLRDTRVFPFPASSLVGASFAGSPYVYALDLGTNKQWRLISPVAAPADQAVAAAFVARALEIDQDDLAAEGVKVSLSTSDAGATSVTVPASFFSDKGLAFADMRDKKVSSFDPAEVARVVVADRSGKSRDVEAAQAADVVSAVSALVAKRVETPAAMPDDFARCGLSKPAFRVVLDFGAAGESVRKNLLVGDTAPDGGFYVSPGGVDAAIFVVQPEKLAALSEFLKASKED